MFVVSLYCAQTVGKLPSWLKPLMRQLDELHALAARAYFRYRAWRSNLGQSKEQCTQLMSFREVEEAVGPDFEILQRMHGW